MIIRGWKLLGCREVLAAAFNGGAFARGEQFNTGFRWNQGFALESAWSKQVQMICADLPEAAKDGDYAYLIEKHLARAFERNLAAVERYEKAGGIKPEIIDRPLSLWGHLAAWWAGK